MRLTLRTLLAHLDGVPLDTEESAEFAKKVEESEFVRTLVQRIRTSVARPRLAAPKVEGQGLGHDPNTVAAYLDNTLPQDRMPDLEKICLESDVLLAEVASCHQILSLVLQTPAKVSPRLRERVYRIGDLGTMPAGEPSAPARQTPVEPPPQEAVAPIAEPPIDERPEVRKKEIPEYLHQTRSLDWKPLALTVAGGFLLAAIVLRLLGPFDAQHPVLGFLARGGAPAESGAVAQGENPVPGSANAETGAQAATRATEIPALPAERGAPGSASAGAAGEPADSGSGVGSSDRTGIEEGAATASADHEGTGTPGAGTAAASAAGSAGESNAAPATPAKQPPAAGSPVSESPPLGDQLAASSPTTDSRILPPVVAAVPPPETPPPAPASALDVGRFISENDLLVRYQPAAAAWVRLPPNAPLAVGDRLLALPAYRPKLALASGVQITLAGGTQIALQSPETPTTAHVAVDFGRLVIVPVGVGNSVRLDLWGRQGEVAFAGPSSLMAVQLRRYRAPGVDPEAGWAHRMVEIHAVHGGLLWREAGHPDQTINAGETFAFLDDARGAVVATEQLPLWVERNDIERSDELAAQEMQAAIATERPLALSLLELVEHRKSEVKALAVRCLGYLNLFEPLVDALNNEGQRSYWAAHFDELQRGLARSPESAREVRIALEKIRGRTAGAELYRMLWSYGPDDLARGDAEKLVNALNSESLDFRVLAIENLRRITGNSLLYRPEYSESRRRVAALRWRDSLTEGKIKYADKVLVLPPRLPPPDEAEPPDEEAE